MNGDVSSRAISEQMTHWKGRIWTAMIVSKLMYHLTWYKRECDRDL